MSVDVSLKVHLRLTGIDWLDMSKPLIMFCPLKFSKRYPNANAHALSDSIVALMAAYTTTIVVPRGGTVLKLMLFAASEYVLAATTVPPGISKCTVTVRLLVEVVKAIGVFCVISVLVMFWLDRANVVTLG